MKTFFSRNEKNRKELQEHIDLVEHVLLFLDDHSSTPDDILALASHGDKWFDIAQTKSWFDTWNMLMFYRLMEKLKKAQDYFNKPLIHDVSASFLAEHKKNKNHYLPIITASLNMYKKQYEFSKKMWEEFNNYYDITQKFCSL